MPHGCAIDEKKAAKLSLLAGGDMDMSSLDYVKYLEELVQEGELEEKSIDQAVRRVLTKKIEFGLFDRSYEFDQDAIDRVMLSEEHRKKALEVGKRSTVLLKNDRVLPISEKVKKILIVGALADDKQALLGPWAFTGSAEPVVTIVEGMRNYAPEGVNVTYVRGFDVNEERSGFDEAYEAARQADLVIAVAGEREFMSGEAASRASLRLAGCQEEFLSGLAELGVPMAVVLINGRPLAIGCLKENPAVGAILEGWHPGTECGNAIAEILFGHYNPSGKLTVTFANDGGQEPMYYNHPNTGKPGSDFKFTSKYQDVPIDPLYPFGYGLSYTEFTYRELKVEEDSLGMDGTLRCSVKVQNTGKRTGEEVVQLYIRDLTASCTRPVKELKRFDKIMLEPGKEREVEFQLPVGEMGFYNNACKYIVEPGEFRLSVGPSSAKGLETTFYVKE